MSSDPSQSSWNYTGPLPAGADHAAIADRTRSSNPFSPSPFTAGSESPAYSPIEVAPSLATVDLVIPLAAPAAAPLDDENLTVSGSDTDDSGDDDGDDDDDEDDDDGDYSQQLDMRVMLAAAGYRCEQEFLTEHLHEFDAQMAREALIEQSKVDNAAALIVASRRANADKVVSDYAAQADRIRTYNAFMASSAPGPFPSLDPLSQREGAWIGACYAEMSAQLIGAEHKQSDAASPEPRAKASPFHCPSTDISQMFGEELELDNLAQEIGAELLYAMMAETADADEDEDEEEEPQHKRARSG